MSTLSVEELMKPRYLVIGDIKSGMYSVCDQGFVINNKTGRRLKEYLNTNKRTKKKPYKYVKLQDGKKSKSFGVAALVAKAFVDNPENKACVNHEDGDKMNNHYTNLKWTTHKENSNHAFKTGLGKSGFSHYSSKFSHEDYWEIKGLKKRGLKNFEIARLYNVADTAIRNLVNGFSYKHVDVPKFDLLNPRFKVKAKYPFSHFKIGDIITTGKNSFLYRTLTQFDDIFSPLQWWEDRNKDDLPLFIKFYNNGLDSFSIGKVSEWRLGLKHPMVKTDADIPYRELSDFDKPATEQEYDSYINSK